jgi:ribosomal protein S18 acetylase RimI-like enzyme
VVDITPYNAELHREGVSEVLAKSGWEERYIAGQLGGLDALSSGTVPGTRGKVYIAEAEGRLCGFISVEFREWNRLGQLHGLAVDPDHKRKGVASVLVRCAENFVRELGGRGVYLDTPVTNEAARSFYRALGYRQAYTMPEYYGEELDGVTYHKFFPEGEGA